jgi:hypothetical protein
MKVSSGSRDWPVSVMIGGAIRQVSPSLVSVQAEPFEPRPHQGEYRCCLAKELLLLLFGGSGPAEVESVCDASCAHEYPMESTDSHWSCCGQRDLHAACRAYSPELGELVVAAQAEPHWSCCGRGLHESYTQ